MPPNVENGSRGPLMRLWVIVNPTGGGGKAKKLIDPLRTALYDRYHQQQQQPQPSSHFRDAVEHTQSCAQRATSVDGGGSFTYCECPDFFVYPTTALFFQSDLFHPSSQKTVVSAPNTNAKKDAGLPSSSSAGGSGRGSEGGGSSRFGGGPGGRLVRPHPLATCQATLHSPVQVVMIHTEGPKDGVRIASAIVSLTSPSRHPHHHPSFYSSPTTIEEDVILAVGGDGTLSEVVNGIAHASLRAYLAQLQQQQSQSSSSFATKDSDGNVEENWNEIESFYASSESGATGWTSMVSPAVRTAHVTAALTRYAPKLVYLAAGTGADFARLGYACRSVADVLRCLPSLHTLRQQQQQQQQQSQTSDGSSQPHDEQTFSSLTRTTPPNAVRMLSSSEGGEHDRLSLPSAPLPSLSMPSSSHTSSHHHHHDAADVSSGSGVLLQGITVHRMDVCSTIFLRTKRRLFYINECSVGLSSDVIERTDRFKKIRWLALFGGFVVFFCAALVTLIKLSPVAMRMRLFQQAPVVSSSSSSCADAPSAPQEGTSAADPCAMSSSSSFSPSTQQQRLLIHHEPSPFPTSAAPQPSPLSLSSAANRPHHQQSPSQSHHHHHHHAKWNKEGVTRDLASLHGQWVSFPASTIVFCNGRFFGGGMQVGPHGDPRSRSLAVTIWHASFWPIILRVASVYTGSHTKWSATATMSGVRYEVDSGQEGVLLKCELDGELPQQESLPVVVEVAGCISMLCPSPPLRK